MFPLIFLFLFPQLNSMFFFTSSPRAFLYHQVLLSFTFLHFFYILLLSFLLFSFSPFSSFSFFLTFLPIAAPINKSFTFPRSTLLPPPLFLSSAHTIVMFSPLFLLVIIFGCLVMLRWLLREGLLSASASQGHGDEKGYNMSRRICWYIRMNH